MRSSWADYVAVNLPSSMKQQFTAAMLLRPPEALFAKATAKHVRAMRHEVPMRSNRVSRTVNPFHDGR
jgi:hypothetical protein